MDQRKFADIIDICEYFPHYELVKKREKSNDYFRLVLYLEENHFSKKKRGLAYESRAFNIKTASYKEVIDWAIGRMMHIRSSRNYYIPECRDIAVKFFLRKD